MLSFKILLCGDARVGKTALVRSMIGNEFDYAARRPSCDTPSVFVPSKDKSLHSMELVVWDVVGGGNSASVIPNAMRNVDVAVLLFDCIATPSEPGSVKRWMMRVKEVSPSAKFVVVASKQDLILGGSGAVTGTDIIASRNGVDAGTLSMCLCTRVVLVSARTGSGVQELVATIAGVMRESPQVERERRNAASAIILALDDAAAMPSRATPQRAKDQAREGCIC